MSGFATAFAVIENTHAHSNPPVTWSFQNGGACADAWIRHWTPLHTSVVCTRVCTILDHSESKFDNNAARRHFPFGFLCSNTAMPGLCDFLRALETCFQQLQCLVNALCVLELGKDESTRSRFRFILIDRRQIASISRPSIVTWEVGSIDLYLMNQGTDDIGLPDVEHVP